MLNSNHHIHYRPDIDGLRAIAVLAVVIFHAFPEWLSGGYVGVDIFFIISGYLITHNIMTQMINGRFTFKDFYSRRIRRIFPALLIVIFVSLQFGWFVLLPDEYRQLGKHAVGGIGFISNLILWKESGYFDVDSHLKPFLHLWSLSIEEQFYLFWPLLLFFAWRLQRKVLLMIFAIMCASFLYSVIEISRDPSLAFYSLLSRSWELLLGGALAFSKIETIRQDAFHSKIFKKISLLIYAESYQAHNIKSWVGIFCIITAVFNFDERTSFPGLLALLPTIGAFLIMSAGPDAWLNRHVLSTRVFVLIGLISYPLYLWHWPILSYLHIFDPEILSKSMRFAAVGASFLLAWLTYKIVEQPLRTKFNSRIAVIGLLGCSVAILLLSVVIYKNNGILSRVNSTVANLSITHDVDEQFRAGRCHLESKQSFRDFAAECFERSISGQNVWLYGDSHAGHLYLSLKNFQGKAGFNLTQTTLSGCAPWSKNNEKALHCAENNTWIVQEIHKHKPNILIISAADFRMVNYKQSLSWIAATFGDVGLGKIIVLGRVPRWKNRLPQHLLNIAPKNPNPLHRLNLEIPHRSNLGLEKYIFRLDKAMKTYIDKNKLPLEYFSPLSILCDAHDCMTLHPESHKVVSYDQSHLTFDGANIVVEKLIEKFN